MYTVVIPFWNGNATLGKLLSSLPKVDSIILVIDKDSKEPNVVSSEIQIVRMKHRGYFTGTVNAGIEAASTLSDILVLNQDVWFTEDYSEIIRINQPIYAIFGDGVFGHPAWPKGYVQGTFMYLRRDAINDIGLFNEKDYPHWGTTCEWQLRAARKGYKAHPMKIPMMHHARRNKGFGSATAKMLADEKDKKSLLIRTPPEISVIVTSYNYGRYLSDNIHSLLGGRTDLGEVEPQTVQSFEVIIVDDGSDGTNQELARQFDDPWKGIHTIVRGKRGGTPAAINTGIANSYGKYITHLAADDMREPWALEELLTAQKANPHSFIYDDAWLFGNKVRDKVWLLEDYDFDKCLVKNQIHAGIMYPRQAWKELGGYPEEMNAGREDWAMNVKLGIHGYCGIHIKKTGYLYRREGQNRSLRNMGESWREVFGKQMYQLFKSTYDGERIMGCCGGGRRAQKQMPYRSNTISSLPGKEGLVLLQYLGGKNGTETYMGAVTGIAYEFSTRKDKGWVDQRDLITNDVRRPGLLELNTFTRKIFKLIPPPSKVAAVTPKVTEKTLPTEVVSEAEPAAVMKKTRKKKTV